MQKEDLAWLIIRAIGLFLMLRVLHYLPDLITATGWLLELGGVTGSESGMALRSLRAMQIQIVSQAGAALVSATLGIYLLRRGKAVFRLLTFSEPKF